jgi:alkylation response protein AidB-like acyl-CoA dehydrogenase
MSPLSFGRASLALTCLSQSAAALAIAFRYACQRRQFSTDPMQR